MRYIDRNIIIQPDSLIRLGETEHLLAHKYYMSADYASQIRKNSFSDHTAYAQADVRNALNLMFNGNCAYCESKGNHLMTLHIEHFRPKGGIKSIPKKEHPGYYWLAADWNNLMLSCENCNQRKVYVLANGSGKTLGKGTYFGILDENFRLKYDESCTLEEPYRLLLNPTLDPVEDYIDYEPDGTIKPKQGILGIENQRVITSIEYFALSRIDLQKFRARKYNKVNSAIRNLESRFNDFLRFGNKEPHRLIELEDALEEISNLINPEVSSHVGVANHLLNDVQPKIASIRKKLASML
jgi:uncharacterized protein (TIGR02646 family)